VAATCSASATPTEKPAVSRPATRSRSRWKSMPSPVRWPSPRTSAALDADPVARTAYDRLSDSRMREHVLAIESAKKPETRIRLIEKALARLRDQEPTGAGRPVPRPGRSPLTSSKGSRLPWRGSTLRLGWVVAGDRPHHTPNHRGHVTRVTLADRSESDADRPQRRCFSPMVPDVDDVAVWCPDENRRTSHGSVATDFTTS
jgi:hypothetical protein